MTGVPGPESCVYVRARAKNGVIWRNDITSVLLLLLLLFGAHFFDGERLTVVHSSSRTQFPIGQVCFFAALDRYFISRKNWLRVSVSLSSTVMAHFNNINCTLL